MSSQKGNRAKLLAKRSRNVRINKKDFALNQNKLFFSEKLKQRRGGFHE